MFKLQPDPVFSLPVALTVPGQADPAEITVRFKHLGVTALKMFFSNLADKTDAEVLAAIVTGWSGVDQAFSQETLARLLDNYPAAAVELLAAYRTAALESRRKN